MQWSTRVPLNANAVIAVRPVEPGSCNSVMLCLASAAGTAGSTVIHCYGVTARSLPDALNVAAV